MTSNQTLLVESCGLLYPIECCHQIFDDFNFFEEECAKTIISKTLGFGIIAGSTVVKLPQIIKILAAKSGEGISVFGTILELLAVVFGAAYGIGKKYPFTSWGEALFLTIETAAIAFFVIYFGSKKVQSFIFLIVFSLISYVLMSGLTPINVLWSLQATNLPLVVVGKLIQAYRNYQNGHTGQLSVITFGLMFLGAFARIFTSIRETGDTLVVMIFVTATLANLIIVCQMLYYWNTTNKVLEAAAKKKKN